VPAGVDVKVDGPKITVKGPKGSLTQEVTGAIALEYDSAARNVLVKRNSDQRVDRAKHGLYRSIINNMVAGVVKGYEKSLEIQGVGFKAAVAGKTITMNLGYSHPINYTIPDQIKVTVEENTKITIEGPDRQVVGQVAAELRGFYPPEPYKGKGVRYNDERVERKEGKTVQ